MRTTRNISSRGRVPLVCGGVDTTTTFVTGSAFTASERGIFTVTASQKSALRQHQYRYSSSSTAGTASPSQIDEWLHCMEFPAPQGGSTSTCIYQEGGVSNVKLKGRFIELVKRYHPDTYMNASSSSSTSSNGGNKEETVEWLNAKVISIVDAHSNLKKVPQDKRQRRAPVDYYSSASSGTANSTPSSGGAGGRTTTQKASYKDYEADCPWSYKPNGSGSGSTDGGSTSWGGGGMGLDYEEVPDPSGSIAWKVPRGPMAGAYRRTMFREVPSAHAQFNGTKEEARAAYRRRNDSGLHFNPFITLRAHQEQSSAAALNGPQFAVDWDIMFGKISSVKKGDIGKEEGEALDGWLEEMKGFWKKVKTEQGENPSPGGPSPSSSSTTGGSTSSAIQSQSSSRATGSERLPREPSHMDRRNAQLKEDNVIQQVLVLALLFSLIAMLGCYGVVLRKLFDRE